MTVEWQVDTIKKPRGLLDHAAFLIQFSETRNLFFLFLTPHSLLTPYVLRLTVFLVVKFPAQVVNCIDDHSRSDCEKKYVLRNTDVLMV